MPKDTVARYLERHAEPLVHTLPPPLRSVRHVICIPACDEDERFEDTLKSIAETDGAERALLILVVNGAEDSDASVHEQNARFLVWLRALLNAGQNTIEITEWNGLQVLLVDRSSPSRRLPARQGVGLARKMAGDLALALHRRGDIQSPWMACTDADVVLPPDYLTALPPDDSTHSASLYPFVHTLEGDVDQQTAMQQYECYLHYYVLGLKSAGSPYAYPSIGSSFAVHMTRYAAVHGFPRKLAAEDFYLLNKLIKQAPLVRLNGKAIQIRGRESTRVPFGTGRAVRDIQAETGAYEVYDPKVFDALGTWLRAQAEFAQNPGSTDWDRALRTPCIPDGLLRQCLDAQGAIAAAEKAATNAAAGAQLRRRLFEWNDAFRTLRLIHELRDGGLPSLPLLDALAAAPFVPACNSETTLESAWRKLVRTAVPAQPTPVGALTQPR